MSPSPPLVLFDVNDAGFASTFLMLVFIAGTVVVVTTMLAVLPLVTPSLAKQTLRVRVATSVIIPALLAVLVGVSHRNVVRAKLALASPNAMVIEGAVENYRHPVRSQTEFTVAGHVFHGSDDPLSTTYDGVPSLKDGMKVRITYSNEGVLKVEDLPASGPVSKK